MFWMLWYTWVRDRNGELATQGHRRLIKSRGFMAQRRDLEEAGCEKLFAEQVSSIAEREHLVCRPRLPEGRRCPHGHQARPRLPAPVRDLMEIVHRIETKGPGCAS